MAERASRRGGREHARRPRRRALLRLQLRIPGRERLRTQVTPGCLTAVRVTVLTMSAFGARLPALRARENIPLSREAQTTLPRRRPRRASTTTAPRAASAPLARSGEGDRLAQRLVDPHGGLRAVPTQPRRSPVAADSGKCSVRSIGYVAGPGTLGLTLSTM